MFNSNSFLVEVKLINPFSQEFTSLIPEQRKKVDELMNQGVIISYALAMDRSVIWIVIEAKKEQQVFDIIAAFPLARFMNANIFELAFHDSIHSGFPHLSLN